jgi:hypothetical protein
MPKNNHKPGVFYPPKLNVWPHEKVTAETLAELGHYVEFRPASNREGEHSADCYVDGVLWELKAPNGKTMKIVSNNLKKARKQSDKVVFDSHRIKNLPDRAVERELRSRISAYSEISRVMFINKRRKVVDIVKPD